MRRWSFGVLLLLALAIPAGLALPSSRTAGGEACMMSCSHGGRKACCCVSGGSGTTLRRCPTPTDLFFQSSAVRVVLPAGPSVPGTPPLAGFLAIVTLGLLLRRFPDSPDPVPKLLF